MTKEKVIPQVRFSGFTDTWEQRELSEVTASFEYGLNAAAKEYDGKHKYIRITDIDDESREFSTEDITSPDTDFSLSDNYILRKGDILFARTGASVGKTYLYREKDGLIYFAGFLIRAKIKSKYDDVFVFQNTLTDNYNKYIRITSQRSGQPGVNAQEYGEYTFLLPKYEEQLRIGEWFTHLDRLITLHQRKYDKLTKVKKAMLEKMFPENGSPYPEIRFKGFTDAWEQRKLSDTLNFLSNNTLSRAELSEDTGTYKNVHYGDVLIKFGEYIDAQSTDLPYIADDEKAKKFESSKLQDGDIIIADTAEDEAVGKCVEIGNIGDLSIVSGLHTIPCRSKVKFAPAYLGFYLNSSSYHDQLIPLMQGIKVTSISKSAISDTLISAPTDLSEQGKIGQFFSQLDTLITLHQRKLEKLKNIKKACLEKMFV